MERLADYYRIRKLIVYNYVGENNDPVKHHVKKLVVMEADLQPLMEEL